MSSEAIILKRAKKMALPLLVGVAAGLAVPLFMVMVRMAGHYIQQPEMELDYAKGLIWAIVLGFSILIWPAPNRDKSTLLILWGAKCFVTLVFMLFYEWSYDLDAYSHIVVARTLTDPFGPMGFGAGTENIHALAWVQGRIVPESYHAMKVTFSMIGLIGVYLIYRGVAAYGFERKSVLLFTGLFPSILFWSSIVGKDPVQLFAIGLYVYGTLLFLRKPSFRYALACAAGIGVAASIRLWMGPILLFPLVLIFLVGVKGFWPKVFWTSAGGTALYTAAYIFADALSINTFAALFERVDGMGAGWEGGSGQMRTADLSSLSGMLSFAPYGMFTALFRPLPGEVMNPFGLLAGIEDVILLGIVVIGLVRLKRAVLFQPVIIWATALVFTWSFVYGFVSVYNLGAAVRFKLQILPVLLLLAGYLAFESNTPLVRVEAPKRRGLATSRSTGSAP